MHSLLEGLSDCLRNELDQCQIQRIGREWEIDAPNEDVASRILSYRWEWHDRRHIQILITVDGDRYTRLSGEKIADRYEKRRARLLLT